jgi:hypothetical protein
MKLLTLCIIALGTLLPAIAADTPSKPIDQMKWMIGTWDAIEGAGPDAETVRVKASLAPCGSAILYHVDVIDGSKVTPRYDGMYYWLPNEKKFAIRQVAITGGASEGEYVQSGDHGSQKTKLLNPDGTVSFIKAEYTLAPDKFRFVAQFQPAEGKDWIPAVDVTYHRVPEK